MAITRDLGKTVQALEEVSVVTCSTGNQVFAATDNVQSCTAAAGINGRVIDRRDVEFGQRRYLTAEPFGVLYTTRGSTEADMKLVLGIKLQHGDSSGGGDAADYSTGSQPATRTLFTTAQTTPMANWTTGAFRVQSNPATYDLTGAKRYLRVNLITSKNRATTESSGFEGYRVSAGLRLGAADELPHVANTTGIGSTSTSTG